MMTYRVQHPIVSSQRGAAGITTIMQIPIGGVVELRDEPQRAGLIEVVWDGKRLRIFAMDLFDYAEYVVET